MSDYRKKLIDEFGGKKDKKKEKVLYTAHFDRLVDLVRNDDSIKFLTADKELLEEVYIDDYKYYPPQIRGLPPQLLIPRADKVLEYAQKHGESGVSGVSGVCKGCTELY